jgi:hypothetical protein
LQSSSSNYINLKLSQNNISNNIPGTQNQIIGQNYPQGSYSNVNVIKDEISKNQNNFNSNFNSNFSSSNQSNSFNQKNKILISNKPNPSNTNYMKSNSVNINPIPANNPPNAGNFTSYLNNNYKDKK